MISGPLRQQFHFVCGKGGVGKSTISCILARVFQNANLRTLLVQVNAEDSHSRILGVEPIGDTVLPIANSLWAVNVTPETSLREYLLLKIHSERLYQIIFNNPVMRSLFHFTPALAELNMLGKIWFHANEKTADGKPLYERIVIDCPASGHGVRFLRVPQITRDGVEKGPIAEEAKAMASDFANPERSCAHFITLAEDMPVNETIELVAQMEKLRLVSRGIIFVNAVLEQLFDEETKRNLALVVGEQEPSLIDLMKVARARMSREELQASQIDRLMHAIDDGQKVLVPAVVDRTIDVSIVDEMAKLVEHLV